jgi:hypothetical protein
VPAVPLPTDGHLDEVTKALEDALYVSVGLGILAFQKAQVQRRELSKAVGRALGDARSTVGDNLKVVEERFRAATER